MASQASIEESGDNNIARGNLAVENNLNIYSGDLILESGQITIRGGSPGAGKVLTSDASGLATWQDVSGASGLSCWDLDGDGVGDPNEDINNDGNFDALDCKGPKGDTGPRGATGPRGPQGPAGDSAQGTWCGYCSDSFPVRPPSFTCKGVNVCQGCPAGYMWVRFGRGAENAIINNSSDDWDAVCVKQ